MLHKSFLCLLLLQAVCEGFDFTFHTSIIIGTERRTSISGQGCGVITCSETVVDSLDESRKISGLTIYKRSSVDGSDSERWEQEASVTSQHPSENKVSDAKRIAGEFSATKAHLKMELFKSNDCSFLDFACVATLIDNSGRTTVIKSFIGGNAGPGEGSGHQPQVHGDRNIDQPENANKLEKLVAVLLEKFQCIETRLGDSYDRDNRFDDKLENLKEKIDSLEKTVSHEIDSSGDRVEDKMDRMKDRLEDKLSGISAGTPLYRIESESSANICSNVSSQLATVESSVESIEKRLKSLGESVSDIKISMPTTTSVDNKLGQIITGVAGVSAKTSTLNMYVEALDKYCTDNSPVPVEEFFDVLDTGRKEWRLAFRGTAYNNVELYPAYLYGTGIPADVEVGCKQFNHSLPCANHYRNRDALENWANVDKVLLALYVRDQIVKQIIFNGKDSTYINWFTGQRVLVSSWNDLKIKTHNIFSIVGDTRVHLLRRFIINHAYGGCEGDKGWFMAGDALPGGCAWEKKLARPIFIYAKGNTMTLWHARVFGRADSMGIFIKYQ